MKVGLFFGSFNPIHTGHLVIAEYMATQTDLEQVWLVVTPHNPLKAKTTLARDHDRFYLVQLAIEGNPRLRASDLEFKLPKPSYTVDTLAYLRERYPANEFCLIMGGDNLPTLPKWKNHEVILEHHEIYVYQRPNHDVGEWAKHPKVHLFQGVPMMDISATYIRQLLQAGESARYLLPERVLDEVLKSGLFR